MNLNDQIGLDEIKRRVDAAIGEVFAELPPDAEWPAVREMARSVAGRLDQVLNLAIYREGLVRVVRKQLSRRNRTKHRAKQGGRKGKR